MVIVFSHYFTYNYHLLPSVYNVNGRAGYQQHNTALKLLYYKS